MLTYCLTNKELLVDAILEEQQRILSFRLKQANDHDNDVSNYAKQKVTEIKRQIKWVSDNRENITSRARL